MNRAFTLIELLVVVLIIGILAAVALPQYQKAVYRARYSQLIVLFEALHKAEYVYRLANGKNTTKFADLDVSLPPGGKLYEASDGDRYEFGWGECKLHSAGYGKCSLKMPSAGEVWYFGYWSSLKGNRECWVTSPNTNLFGDALCKSLTQNEAYGSSSSYKQYKFKK